MRAALRKGENPRTLLEPKHDPAALTFRAYAERYIAYLRTTQRKGKLRNSKAVDQWPSTLAKWVYPHKGVGASLAFGDKRPGDITYGDVKAALTQRGLPELAETQKRVRQRIRVVLDEAAKEEGEPHRHNPALSFKLEPRGADTIKHHAAASWQDVPAVMAALRLKDSTSALLLRFSILTAARSGEARGALWAEIDLTTALWTIPASRMKGGKLHAVPLSAEALAILKIMADKKAEAVADKKVEESDRVFPGARGGLISDVAVAKTLRAVLPGVTAHGFRSSFREWGSENTNFPREALELALAHINPNKVEAAYQRSGLVEIRVKIMAAWADYLNGSSNIVELRTANAA